MIQVTDVNRLKSSIPGWGTDLDPARRPGVPREKPPHLHDAFSSHAHLAEPEQQVPKTLINKSLERPGLSAVFGGSVPPRGLSGLLRNYSYSTFSEGEVRHWLLLMLADRVDVMEGIAEDLFHGHIPNIFKEQGWKVDLKESPATLTRRSLKLAVGLAVIGGGLYYLMNRPEKKRIV